MLSVAPPSVMRRSASAPCLHRVTCSTPEIERIKAATAIRIAEIEARVRVVEAIEKTKRARYRHDAKHMAPKAVSERSPEEEEDMKDDIVRKIYTECMERDTLSSMCRLIVLMSKSFT